MKNLHIFGKISLLVVIFFNYVISGKTQGSDEPGRVVTANSQVITLEFHNPQYTRQNLVDEKLGSCSKFFLSSDYTRPFAALGAPDLPVICRLVQVPDRGDISLEIVDQEIFPLGKVTIPPYQKPPTHCQEKFPYMLDNNIYSANKNFPATAAELVSVEIFRDIRVARIFYCPIQYNPVSREVSLVTQVVIRIKSSPKRGVNELHLVDKGPTRSFIPFYRDIFNINPSMLDPKKQDQVGCYVFLGSDATLEAVKDFIIWKRKKGLKVHVANMDSVGTTGKQVDAWIEKIYTQWTQKPEYMFLIGSEKVVPTMDGQNGTSQRTESDNKLGVIGSGVIPSVHIGRISGKDESIDNLHYQAWKILMHETDPLEGEWLTKGETWGCSQPNGEPTATKWKNILEKGGLRVKVELEKNGAAKGAELVGHFNDGLCTFGYKGHGAKTTMSSAKINVSTLSSNLDNGRKFTFLNNIGCNCAEFSGVYTISEAWMSEGSKDNPKGAMSVFSFTVSSSVGGSDNLLSGIYEGLFGTDPLLWQMGPAVVKGKKACSNNTDNHGGMLWGCPEITLHTKATLPSLKVTESLTLDGSKKFTVTDGTSPVKGALLGVVKKSDYSLLGSGYTNASGELILDLPKEANEAYLTATFRNCKPFMGELGNTGILIDDTEKVSFMQAFPNPLRHSINWQFNLTTPGNIELSVYSMTGKRVHYFQSNLLSKGKHTLAWNGKTSKGHLVPNGIYIYKITTPIEKLTQTISILR